MSTNPLFAMRRQYLDVIRHQILEYKAKYDSMPPIVHVEIPWDARVVATDIHRELEKNGWHLADRFPVGDDGVLRSQWETFGVGLL